LIYSTYLGSIGNETEARIAVDGAGSAYVTGITYLAPLGFPDVTPSISNGPDAFVWKLDAAGSALLYSLCLCGSSSDGGRGIALDGLGNAYVAGSTASPNFPTVNPMQPYGGGSSDGFVTKISDRAGDGPTVTAIQPRSGARGTSVNVTLMGTNFVTESTSVTVSGDGVTVGPVNVASSTSLTTVFVIASAATPGSRTVKVKTPAGTTMDGVTFIVGDPLFPTSR
jgi:IPT/TIG domain/Beta-propeller repeat